MALRNLLEVEFHVKSDAPRSETHRFRPDTTFKLERLSASTKTAGTA